MDFKEFLVKLIVSLVLGLLYTQIFCYIRDWEIGWWLIFGEMSGLVFLNLIDGDEHGYCMNVFFLIIAFLLLLLEERIFF